MNRLIASLAFALGSVLILNASTPWTRVANRLQKSIVFLEQVDLEGIKKGACSGFMIDQERHYILTAGHCDGPVVLADGKLSVRVLKDVPHDLMVLLAPDVNRPGLDLADRDPDRGDETASMGYGYGLEFPMFRLSHVASIQRIDELSGSIVLLDAAVVSGMSGGPMVNHSGKVIGIVQREGEDFGVGVGKETLRERVGKFFRQ